jgi:hypothetical protein
MYSSQGPVLPAVAEWRGVIRMVELRRSLETRSQSRTRSRPAEPDSLSSIIFTREPGNWGIGAALKRLNLTLCLKLATSNDYMSCSFEFLGLLSKNLSDGHAERVLRGGKVDIIAKGPRLA